MFTCLGLAGHQSVAASWILGRIAFLPGESGQQGQAANPQSDFVCCHGGVESPSLIFLSASSAGIAEGGLSEDRLRARKRIGNAAKADRRSLQIRNFITTEAVKEFNSC